MKIILCITAQAAYEVAPNVLTRHIRKKPSSIVGLATGRTMEAIYKILVE